MLGLPGCARSPKVNGFDWVLERLCAGVPVGREDIMRMGAGGLLAEIPSRPLPRAEAQPATGRAEGRRKSRRDRASPRCCWPPAGRRAWAGRTSCSNRVDGTPMVARTAQRLLSSRARPIVAVLGNQADAIDRALGKLPVERVRNPAFAEGLSTSLKCGLAALPNDIDGVVVCLGDMPLITGRDIDRLIAAFNPLEGRAIIVPTRRGKRGNPVLWARRFFAEMAELAGDVGAKHLIGEHAELVCEVEMDTDGVLVDIDTPGGARRISRQDQTERGLSRIAVVNADRLVATSVLRDNLLWSFADSRRGSMQDEMRTSYACGSGHRFGLLDCVLHAAGTPRSKPGLSHSPLYGARFAGGRDCRSCATRRNLLPHGAIRFPRPGSSGAHGGCSRRRTTRTSWAITRPRP